MSFLAEQAGGLGTTGTTRVSPFELLHLELHMFKCHLKILHINQNQLTKSVSSDLGYCARRRASEGTHVCRVKEGGGILREFHKEIKNFNKNDEIRQQKYLPGCIGEPQVCIGEPQVWIAPGDSGFACLPAASPR